MNGIALDFFFYQALAKLISTFPNLLNSSFHLQHLGYVQ